MNDVTFYANLADPERPDEAARVPDAAGRERTCTCSTRTPRRPTAGGSTGNYTLLRTSSTRIDGKYLDTTQPIFSYFDANGNADHHADHDHPGLRSIDSVGINLRVRVTPTSPIVVINTTVHVRNTDYNPNT